MERILDILPAAKKWSLILFILSAVMFAFNIYSLILDHDLSGLIGLIMQGFLTYFLFAYYRACDAGIKDESEESVEEACRQQKNIFIIYGIQAIFMLLAFFLVAPALVMLAFTR